MQLLQHPRYVAWNTRIAMFWLTRPNESGHVYLTVTPASLAAAAWECDGTSLTPDEALQDFVESVREMYRSYIIGGRHDLASLAQLHDGIPLSIAFLAASVVAAYQMRDDHLRRSTAYFPRLAELLGYTAALEEPPNFSRQSFEELWYQAAAWTQARLVVGGDVLRHYEAHPLAHAALRQVDLERLPGFFEWASYAPGASIAPERLRADFMLWLSGGSRLTPRGLDACLGEQQEAVHQQIAVELKAWNGIAPDPAGRRISTVELALDLPRGIPKLSLLARRPVGFPESFEHEGHRFDSLSEGWYEPLPLPPNGGDLLLNGFEWISRQQTPHCILRRAGSSVIAFAVSEDTAGLVSRRRLLAGVECALLVHESVEQVARQRVALLSDSSAHWNDDPELPTGWKLVERLQISNPRPDEVPGLEALEVDAAAELVARGGLRASRRAEWLVEAPPRVYASGFAPSVTIDERPVRVGADGCIAWERHRMRVGEHRVGIGRFYKRIGLVEAQVSPTLVELVQASAAPRSFPVGLPRGGWALLGERSTAVFNVDLHSPQVVAVPFEPVWVLGRSCALYILDREGEPDVVASNDRAWAQVITAAVGRQVELATIDPSMARAAQRAWREFQAAAGRVLRGNQLAGERGPS